MRRSLIPAVIAAMSFASVAVGDPASPTKPAPAPAPAHELQITDAELVTIQFFVDNYAGVGCDAKSAAHIMACRGAEAGAALIADLSAQLTTQKAAAAAAKSATPKKR